MGHYSKRTESGSYTATAEVHQTFEPGTVPDERLMYGQQVFRPDNLNVTWRWDFRELQWEISRIHSRGQRVLKSGKTSDNEFSRLDNTYHLGGFAPNKVSEELLRQAEAVRPDLTA